ncbi:aldo/keto reductase [Ktedonosporobacter rubrisoli]|uniref:Aldo/keto reductase n=1 Tax=Ktedonosporobacter rubrisoli TaxID=2509675 RepID=A0A4P6JXT7_KTERU|nr:aldo/keto reductase [Ktedonosporobacter rubrisoli]QBD80210.1 aldo/keto reductase [Ktedonosporobacter rubrisoli]
MRYKLLGTSGLRVSELCLGTMTFGENWGWGATRAESRKIYEAFVEAGGNFLDTANIYTEGESEKLLGEFIATDRERIVLATKYACYTGQDNPNGAGNHRKSMVQALEASLKRLKTDYIDLYYVHAWDFLSPVEEVMRALDDLVRAGKVLYLGISSVPAWVVAQANTLVERYGWSPFVALSIQYNLVERTPERELLPMAQSFGVSVTAWSPLAYGLLSGKYTREESKQAAGKVGRLASNQFRFNGRAERDLTIAHTVQQVADEISCTPPQVALAWLRAQSQGIIPIISGTNASQLRDNLGCLDVRLSPEHLQRLDTVSRIPQDHPVDFLADEGTRQLVYGGIFNSIDTNRHAQLLNAIQKAEAK